VGIMTLRKAREVALKLRCDHRSVLRAWREPGCVRGMLGEALEIELAPLRAADAQPHNTELPAGGGDTPSRGRVMPTSKHEVEVHR